MQANTYFTDNVRNRLCHIIVGYCELAYQNHPKLSSWRGGAVLDGEQGGTCMAVPVQ
jgi:hypothetical protein